MALASERSLLLRLSATVLVACSLTVQVGIADICDYPFTTYQTTCVGSEPCVNASTCLTALTTKCYDDPDDSFIVASNVKNFGVCNEAGPYQQCTRCRPYWCADTQYYKSKDVQGQCNDQCTATGLFGRDPACVPPQF